VFVPICLVHRGCLSIETFQDGMDFYFPDRGKAARFISFLENSVPTKMKTSKKLIGTDDKSNVSNYKYTSYVEICPLCKDDLLYLPARTARDHGNISRLVMVKAISNVIHLIDPLSGQIAQLSPESYWRKPLRPVITAARSRMTRFVVLGKEPVVLRRNVSKRSTSRKQRSRLARVTLARENDLGINDQQFEELSHAGYLLKAGDVCVGFDLTETQFVEDEAENMRTSGKLPGVVVIRKLYGGAAKGDASKKRRWKLQRLDTTATESWKSSRAEKKYAEVDDLDEEDFMREVEADRDMRDQINLYKSKLVKRNVKVIESSESLKNKYRKNNISDDNDDDDDQEIRLEELLDGLAMNDSPDVEDILTGDLNKAGLEEGEKAAMDGIHYVGREKSRFVKAKEGAIPQVSFGKEFRS